MPVDFSRYGTGAGSSSERGVDFSRYGATPVAAPRSRPTTPFRRRASNPYPDQKDTPMRRLSDLASTSGALWNAMMESQYAPVPEGRPHITIFGHRIDAGDAFDPNSPTRKILRHLVRGPNYLPQSQQASWQQEQHDLVTRYGSGSPQHLKFMADHGSPIDRWRLQHWPLNEVMTFGEQMIAPENMLTGKVLSGPLRFATSKAAAAYRAARKFGGPAMEAATPAEKWAAAVRNRAGDALGQLFDKYHTLRTWRPRGKTVAAPPGFDVPQPPKPGTAPPPGLNRRGLMAWRAANRGVTPEYASDARRGGVQTAAGEVQPPHTVNSFNDGKITAPHPGKAAPPPEPVSVFDDPKFMEAAIKHGDSLPQHMVGWARKLSPLPAKNLKEAIAELSPVFKDTSPQQRIAIIEEMQGIPRSVNVPEPPDATIAERANLYKKFNAMNRGQKVSTGLIKPEHVKQMGGDPDIWNPMKQYSDKYPVYGARHEEDPEQIVTRFVNQRAGGSGGPFGVRRFDSPPGKHRGILTLQDYRDAGVLLHPDYDPAYQAFRDRYAVKTAMSNIGALTDLETIYDEHGMPQRMPADYRYVDSSGSVIGGYGTAGQEALRKAFIRSRKARDFHQAVQQIAHEEALAEAAQIEKAQGFALDEPQIAELQARHAATLEKSRKMAITPFRRNLQNKEAGLGKLSGMQALVSRAAGAAQSPGTALENHSLTREMLKSNIPGMQESVNELRQAYSAALAQASRSFRSGYGADVDRFIHEVANHRFENPAGIGVAGTDSEGNFKLLGNTNSKRGFAGEVVTATEAQKLASLINASKKVGEKITPRQALDILNQAINKVGENRDAVESISKKYDVPPTPEKLKATVDSFKAQLAGLRGDIAKLRPVPGPLASVIRKASKTGAAAEKQSQTRVADYQKEFEKAKVAYSARKLTNEQRAEIDRRMHEIAHNAINDERLDHYAYVPGTNVRVSDSPYQMEAQLGLNNPFSAGMIIHRNVGDYIKEAQDTFGGRVMPEEIEDVVGFFNMINRVGRAGILATPGQHALMNEGTMYLKAAQDAGVPTEHALGDIVSSIAWASPEKAVGTIGKRVGNRVDWGAWDTGAKEYVAEPNFSQGKFGFRKYGITGGPAESQVAIKFTPSGDLSWGGKMEKAAQEGLVAPQAAPGQSGFAAFAGKKLGGKTVAPGWGHLQSLLFDHIEPAYARALFRMHVLRRAAQAGLDAGLLKKAEANPVDLARLIETYGPEAGRITKQLMSQFGDAAAEDVRSYLGSYDNITNFERNVLKVQSWLLFYPWLKTMWKKWATPGNLINPAWWNPAVRAVSVANQQQGWEGSANPMTQAFGHNKDGSLNKYTIGAPQMKVYNVLANALPLPIHDPTPQPGQPASPYAEYRPDFQQIASTITGHVNPVGQVGLKAAGSAGALGAKPAPWMRLSDPLAPAFPTMAHPDSQLTQAVGAVGADVFPPLQALSKLGGNPIAESVGLAFGGFAGDTPGMNADERKLRSKETRWITGFGGTGKRMGEINRVRTLPIPFSAKEDGVRILNDMLDNRNKHAVAVSSGDSENITALQKEYQDLQRQYREWQRTNVPRRATPFSQSAVPPTATSSDFSKYGQSASGSGGVDFSKYGQQP